MKSIRSGPFSWTKSAARTAAGISAVNVRRDCDAPGARPNRSSAGQAAFTKRRSDVSASGAISVAMTSSPFARNSAVQLAPMTPVPMMATRRIGLLLDMVGSPLIGFQISRVSDAGEIALREEKVAFSRSVEPGGIDRAGEIGHEHPIARDIQRDADPFHQMRQHDLRRLRLCIDGCAVHRVAARRVAAIGPVEDAILAVELEIDRLRQAVEEHLDVGALGGGLTFGDFDAGAEDSALLSIVRALLRPVDLLAFGIDRDPNAPPGLIAPIGVATAGLDERFNLRAVEIRAHDAHPFAVAPVELAVLLIELDLLRRERGAPRNDDPAILSVEIGALDGAIVCAGTGAHVGPVDMAGSDIDRDAVRQDDNR